MADTIDKGAALQALGEAVRAALSDGVVQSIEVERGAELVLRIRREALLPAMTLLRDGDGFAFEQLMDLCGTDWPERPLRFDVDEVLAGTP